MFRKACSHFSTGLLIVDHYVMFGQSKTKLFFLPRVWTLLNRILGNIL